MDDILRLLRGSLRILSAWLRRRQIILREPPLGRRQLLQRGDQLRSRRLDRLLTLLRLLSLHKGPNTWISDLQRQRYGFDRQFVTAKERRSARLQRRLALDLVALIATGVKERLGIQLLIKHTNQAAFDRPIRLAVDVLLERPRIGLTLHALVTQFQRFEESTETEILLLTDWIVLVIVAMGTVERQAEKGLARVFDLVAHPRVVVPLEPVADDEPGGNDILIVAWLGLIGGQHLDDHAIIALVLVQGTHDPVAPAPDLWIAVHHIRHGAAAVP